MTPELRKLWEDFKKTKSKDSKDKLILNYSPLVKYVASRIYVGLPSNVDQADLVSYGIFGLIDAIEKFDLDRNVKFETYAISRIRGAIIDELRALDWMPRSLRTKSKEFEKVYMRLEQEFGREPTDAEIAKELGISVKELNGILAKLSYGSVIALDEMRSMSQEKSFDINLGEMLEDKDSSDPTVIAETDEIKEILSSAINNLSYKEKVIITLYYYEGLTLREIGKVLGITESRASQLHTKSLIILKTKLRAFNLKSHELVDII